MKCKVISCQKDAYYEFGYCSEHQEGMELSRSSGSNIDDDFVFCPDCEGNGIDSNYPNEKCFRCDGLGGWWVDEYEQSLEDN